MWNKSVFQTEWGMLSATGVTRFAPIAQKLGLDFSSCWDPCPKSAVFMYIYAAKATEKVREKEVMQELYS